MSKPTFSQRVMRASRRRAAYALKKLAAKQRATVQQRSKGDGN